MHHDTIFPRPLRHRFPYRTRRLGSILVAILVAIIALAQEGQGRAQDASSNRPSTAPSTLAIYPVGATATSAGRPLPEELWAAIETALREQLASGVPETQVLAAHRNSPEAGPDSHFPLASHAALPEVQILRGDRIPPGLSVENPITVYLHGGCEIVPRPRPLYRLQPSVSGPLGWVILEKGHIKPFMHVECGRLAQMLATEAWGLDRGQRNRMMAVAIARVIVHEWIHVATQNPGHSQYGLGKAQFDVRDLTAGPVDVRQRQGGR